MFGFEKNERSTISAAELEALQTLAAELLNLHNEEIDQLMLTDKLTQICYGYQN